MSKHDIGENPYTFTEFTASDANMRKDEVERLRKLTVEMLAVLKEVEWLEIWDDYVDGPLYDCPICRNLVGKGHHEDCILGNVIAKALEENNGTS